MKAVLLQVVAITTKKFMVVCNWLLNGHKFKLQAGVQYAKMDDKANDGGEYDGWGLNVALRAYW